MEGANFYFFSAKYGKVFTNLHPNQPISNIFVGRLESGEVLIQISGTLKLLLNPKHVSKDIDSLFDSPISCSTVFPSSVNTQLAVRQTFSLASKLNDKFQIILSMFE